MTFVGSKKTLQLKIFISLPTDPYALKHYVCKVKHRNVWHPDKKKNSKKALEID